MGKLARCGCLGNSAHGKRHTHLDSAGVKSGERNQWKQYVDEDSRNGNTDSSTATCADCNLTADMYLVAAAVVVKILVVVDMKNKETKEILGHKVKMEQQWHPPVGSVAYP